MLEPKREIVCHPSVVVVAVEVNVMINLFSLGGYHERHEAVEQDDAEPKWSTLSYWSKQ